MLTSPDPFHSLSYHYTTSLQVLLNRSDPSLTLPLTSIPDPTLHHSTSSHRPMSRPSRTPLNPSNTLYTSFVSHLTPSEPIQTAPQSQFCPLKIDLGPPRHPTQQPRPSKPRARRFSIGVFACYLHPIRYSARVIHPYSARFTRTDPLLSTFKHTYLPRAHTPLISKSSEVRRRCINTLHIICASYSPFHPSILCAFVKHCSTSHPILHHDPRLPCTPHPTSSIHFDLITQHPCKCS